MCERIHTSGFRLLQEKSMRLFTAGHHQFSLSQRQQQDRFNVPTAGQALIMEIAFAQFYLISSWLKRLILPGTAWRCSSRRLDCMMFRCGVKTEVAQTSAACSGVLGNGGCSCKEPSAKRVTETL